MGLKIDKQQNFGEQMYTRLISLEHFFILHHLLHYRVHTWNYNILLGLIIHTYSVHTYKHSFHVKEKIYCSINCYLIYLINV